MPARPGANDDPDREARRRRHGLLVGGRAPTTTLPAPRRASGSRQLAISRKYALLTPVTVQDRIVYRETAVHRCRTPGDVLTVRLTVAGSPEWRYLAIEDPLPAGVEAIQDTTAYPLENAKRGFVVVGIARRISRLSAPCSSRKSSNAAATSTSTS